MEQRNCTALSETIVYCSFTCRVLYLFPCSHHHRALLPEKQQEKQQSIIDVTVRDIEQFCSEMEDCAFFQKILESLKTVPALGSSNCVETPHPIYGLLWYRLHSCVQYLPIPVCLRFKTPLVAQHPAAHRGVRSSD